MAYCIEIYKENFLFYAEETDKTVFPSFLKYVTYYPVYLHTPIKVMHLNAFMLVCMWSLKNDFSTLLVISNRKSLSTACSSDLYFAKVNTSEPQIKCYSFVFLGSRGQE